MKPITKSRVQVFIQILASILILLSGPVLPLTGVHRILVLLSASLGLWAIVTMRPGNFNIGPHVKEDARLTANGPYRLVRHPMYAALLLFMLTLLLAHFNYPRLLFWLLLVVDILAKIAYEEELLSRHFQEYSDYKQVTKRLIPFLY